MLQAGVPLGPCPVPALSWPVTGHPYVALCCAVSRVSDQGRTGRILDPTSTAASSTSPPRLFLDLAVPFVALTLFRWCSPLARSRERRSAGNPQRPRAHTSLGMSIAMYLLKAQAPIGTIPPGMPLPATIMSGCRSNCSTPEHTAWRPSDGLRIAPDHILPSATSACGMTSWATLAVVLVACQLTLVASVISQHLGPGTGALAPASDVSWTQSDVSPPDVNSDLFHHLGDHTLLHADSATDDKFVGGSAQYQAALAAVSDCWPLHDDVGMPVGNVHVSHPESIILNQIQADPRPATQVVHESHSATYFPWHSTNLLVSSHHDVGNWPTLCTVNGIMEMPTGNVHAWHPESNNQIQADPRPEADQIVSESLSCAYLPRHCPDLVSGDLVISYGVPRPSSAVDGETSNGNVPSSSIRVPFLPFAHADEQLPSPFNSNECPPTDVHLPVDLWHDEHGLWSTSPPGDVDVSSIGNDVPGVSSVLSDMNLLSFINSEGHSPNAFHSPISSIQVDLQPQIATQEPPDTSLSTWPAHAIGDIPIDAHSIDTSDIASDVSHAAACPDDADCCPQSSIGLQRPQFPDNGHWMETAPTNVLSAAECIASQSMQYCWQNQVAADPYAWNLFTPAPLNPAQIREGDYGTFSRIISEPPSLQSLAASSHDRCSTAVPVLPEAVRPQCTTDESVNMGGLQLQQRLPKPPRRPRKSCEHCHHKHMCKICSPHIFCEAHGRRKWDCTICGGPGTCVHGRQTYRCGDCGGKGRCPHDRRRDQCRECRGSSICKHDKVKYHCKACGGKGLCAHQRQKGRCGECRRAAELDMA